MKFKFNKDDQNIKGISDIGKLVESTDWNS